MQMRTLATLLLLAAALSGCGRERKVEQIQAIDAKRPPLPAWASSLVGKRLATVFPTRTTCQGSTDVITKRFTREPVGLLIEGWAWDGVAGKPITRVILVNSGLVVGAGDGGRERADVPKALPQVTTSKVGWQAVSNVASGEIAAFGVTEAGICPIGAQSL